jgi:two-component system, NarL family, invasion response regulator UvrY
LIRILIADDHAIVRKGLRQIVSETEDMVVADEAERSQEALSKALKNDYDVLLLDLSMPDRSGLEVLQRLRSEKPKLPVLVLSIHSEEQYAVRALRAGAAGYLTKASAPEELIAALRKVSSGGKYVSSSLAEKLASDLRAPDDKPPHEGLSHREFEILQFIASGRTVGEIAQQLSLRVKTVSTYRTRVLEKMHRKTNAELTRYAIEQQLVE